MVLQQQNAKFMLIPIIMHIFRRCSRHFSCNFIDMHKVEMQGKIEVHICESNSKKQHLFLFQGTDAVLI